jgi:hypothetical protein
MTGLDQRLGDEVVTHRPVKERKQVEGAWVPQQVILRQAHARGPVRVGASESDKIPSRLEELAVWFGALERDLVDREEIVHLGRKRALGQLRSWAGMSTC